MPRTAKIRAGFYRFGAYCVHGHGQRWMIYRGPQFIKRFPSLKFAREWALTNTGD